MAQKHDRHINRLYLYLSASVVISVISFTVSTIVLLSTRETQIAVQSLQDDQATLHNLSNGNLSVKAIEADIIKSRMLLIQDDLSKPGNVMIPGAFSILSRTDTGLKEDVRVFIGHADSDGTHIKVYDENGRTRVQLGESKNKEAVPIFDIDSITTFNSLGDVKRTF